jgi:hypothetical protein
MSCEEGCRIICRFTAGLHNFEEIYKEIVNEWVVYDNSSRTPVLIGEGGKR